MAKRKLTTIKAIPFQGGCNTAVEPALLDKPSMIQNFRQKHPGLVKRQGQIKQHSTADGTNKVLSMYQFVKGKKTERHFYAQFSDDDVLEATTAPPGVTTGAFGSQVFSGTASSLPASWANVNDLLIFANGVDTAQIYPGTASPVEKFIVYNGTSAIPTAPEIGTDYTTEVTDGSTTTAAILDSQDTIANFDCIMVMTPVPIDGLNFTIKAANGNAATASVLYWTGAAWATVGSVTDTTASAGKTFAVTGSWTWTLPTNHVPSYLYGVNGFWYMLGVSAALDSEVEISSVTYESDWQAMQSIWDGTPIPAIEAYTYDASAGSYSVYGSEAIDIGGLINGSDLIYFASYDPAAAILIEGSSFVPAGADLTSVKYWNGSAWTAFSSIIDNSDGMTKNGWVLFARPSDIQKYTFNSSPYYAYWYQIEAPKSGAIVCMNCDGADASTTVTDLSGKSWTTVGNTQIDTAQYKYGTASLLFDGTGDSLRTVAHSDFNFGSGDFTFEFWARVTDLTAARTLFTFSCSKAASTDYFYITVVAAITTGVTTATIASETSNVLTLAVNSLAVGTISAATWHHIAVMRKDGVYQAFLDGVAATKATASTEVNGGTVYYDGTTPYQFDWQNSAPYLIQGWLDDIKISKHAVYTIDTNFTAPAAAATLTISGSIPANTTIGISTAPYFDITEYGKAQTVASWKNRLAMGTDQDHYVYLSASGQPQVLTGDDTTILAPGDGRYNRPVAMRNFQDDLLIFQEEKGKEGGCITKYAWVTSVDDISKTIISTTLGAMNAKSVDIVDGVEFAELNRDQPIMSLAFFLSRYGVFVTDGVTTRMISQDIQNYFDPTQSACIRVGYETQHWLKYDSAYGVIRIGLVSGSSATVPNVFPVYDVHDKSWSFDSLAQEFSCMTEAEAGSGAVTVVQLGGGVDDGTVYVSNSGTNDVSTAIDSYVTAEIDGKGEILHMGELLLRAKVQSAGSITVTPSLNSIAQTAVTLAQTAETANQTIRRHRINTNHVSQHISLKVQHNTASESCQLLDMGVGLEVYEDQ